MFRNSFPRLEPVSPDGLATIERGWMRLVSEIGVRFDHPEAVRILVDAGQRAEGDIVFFDPEWVLEQVAKVPSEFTLCARNAANDIQIGGDQMVFLPVQGPPFVRRGLERRDGTLADFDDFCRLAQTLPDFDLVGSLPCEPNDIPLDSRHL
ncbi:MAG: trimethylamine methyltransferase family protein, partial [Thermoleophilia bacterium]